MIPVLMLLARGDRAQPPHRLYRPDLARHRRLHGGRRLCLLQAHDCLPGRQHHRADPRSGFFSAAVGVVFGLPSLRIKGFYLAVATLAAQFFLSWCFIRVPWLYNYNVSARSRCRPAPVRHSDHRAERDAGDALSGRAVDRRRDDLARLQPRARPHRPHVDGGARHGYRGRADRHPALSDQAARLRGVVVLLRRRRRADGVPLARRRGSRESSTSTNPSSSCSWSSSAGSAA